MRTIILLFWNYFAGKGVKKATEELFNKRISICRSNTCGDYEKPFKLKCLERCGDCGCFLNAKARIDEWYVECPKQLW